MNVNPMYRWIAAAIGVLIVGFMIWYFHTIVYYILASAVFAIMGRPLVKVLKNIKIANHTMPSWIPPMLTLMVMGIVIILLAGAFIPVIFDKLNFLSSYNIEELNALLAHPVRELEMSLAQFFPKSDISIKEVIERQIDPLLKSGFIQDTIGSFTTFMADIAIAAFSITFITFFFLKEDTLFNEGVVALFPQRYAKNVQRAIGSTTTLLIRYFIGICIESLIKLVIVGVSMYIIGFDFNTSIIIGLITSVLNVVPYIGPIIGGLIAFLIAAITPVPDVAIGTVMLQIGVVLLAFQLLDNVILQPYIYSSSVKAHPLEIFIVILMAGYMAGIMGMLFAIPAYTVLRVFAKEFFNHFTVVQKLTEKI